MFAFNNINSLGYLHFKQLQTGAIHILMHTFRL